MSFWSFFLLADRSQWERLGDGFQQKINHPIGIDELLVGAGIVGTLAVFVLLLQDVARRQAKPRTYCRPHQIFHQLCVAHHLTKRDRHLLSKMATLVGLEQPAEVFVRPELFSTATVAKGLSAETERLEKLQRQLFGTLGG